MATLHEAAVRRWLQDQQAAMQQIEKERVRRLLALSAEEAQRIYLSLYQSKPPFTDRTEPSPLLMAMRHVLARRSQ